MTVTVSDPVTATVFCDQDIWRSNTEAEHLLGVSLTGIMDNRLTSARTASGDYADEGVADLATLLETLKVRSSRPKAQSTV
eukprot:6488942-Pyramimonas_sp.AAC.1